MNNIRKIIEERLENAKLDFGKTTREFNAELKGQIEAYQDCLNLLDEYTLKIDTEQLGVKEIETLFETFNNSQLGIMSSKELSYYATNPKRTEQDVLKDFEKLGYQIVVNNASMIYLTNKSGITLHINKLMKWYGRYNEDNEIARYIPIQEHKLLTELFTIWRWL